MNIQSIRNIGFKNIASVVEWSITRDCKSLAFGLRRFESCPAHMDKEPKFYSNESLSQKYRDKLNQIALDKGDQYLMDLFDIIRAKSDDLRGKYGDDVYKYSLYHVLIGSTMNPDFGVIGDDFPGDDSVALFIDELAKPQGLG